MPVTAREAAYKALGAFRRDGAWPAKVLEAYTADMSQRDAALAMRILRGTVQNLARCDHYITQASNVRKIEPQVKDILRISVYQMIFMDKIPQSAAVSEGVALARKYANPRAAGFVNAVLRKISEMGTHGIIGPAIETLPVWYSHPEWLVRELCDTLGADGAEAFLRENNRDDVPITAQVNTLATDIDNVLDVLKNDGIDAERHAFIENAVEMRAPGSVLALKVFKNGHIYIQDASARLAVATAGVRPGDTVLDACAAPGGKSFAAAIDMQNRGEILSCDIFDKKLRLIEDGAKRLGIGIIKTRALDATEYAGELHEHFDVVIADAPCSGLGVIRKKPEIRYKAKESIAGLPELQLAILNNVSRYVKPGGVLLYSTCTILRRENEDIVRAFIETHPEFNAEEMMTLWPHINGTDGFFICRMRKA